MLFGHKLQIELGDLLNEQTHLASFIESKLKVNFTMTQSKLVSDSQAVTPQDLEKVVNKFIYHQKLNSKHWVSLEKNTVKINTFKGKEKKEEKKPDKHNKNTGHTQSLTQSWGL